LLHIKSNLLKVNPTRYMPSEFHLIGKGVYTLAEAYRLTGVPSRRIVRWTQGYDFDYRGSLRHSPPIIASADNLVDDQPILDFLDLIEIRFLNAFREYGVGWKAIRIAGLRARELLQRTHPFSTRKFKTDGRTILAEFVAETGDRVLLDLVKHQYKFRKVIDPYLYGGLDFNEYEEPSRWWPLGRNRRIVIDPKRGFGAPIIARHGIATRVISQSYQSLQSYEAVAGWFETDTKSVYDAIEYESKLVH